MGREEVLLESRAHSHLVVTWGTAGIVGRGQTSLPAPSGEVVMFRIEWKAHWIWLQIDQLHIRALPFTVLFGASPSASLGFTMKWGCGVVVSPGIWSGTW